MHFQKSLTSIKSQIQLLTPIHKLTICLLLIVLLIWLIWLTTTKTQIKQPMIEQFEMIRVGSNDYKVHEDLTNPKLAAETMDQLNQTATQFIAILNAKYINDPQGMDAIKPEYRDIISQGITSLSKNFKTANMEENIPERSGGDTSYVIDKGAVFAMCLRDPRNNNTVDTTNDLNELKFVLIHEMAHLFTSTYGHDSLFWNNFKFMLQEASDNGLYVPIDYKKNGHPYCGIVISYSPMYDTDLKDYFALKSII